jgi:hypothetical protein
MGSGASQEAHLTAPNTVEVSIKIPPSALRRLGHVRISRGTFEVYEYPALGFRIYSDDVTICQSFGNTVADLLFCEIGLVHPAFPGTRLSKTCRFQEKRVLREE